MLIIDLSDAGQMRSIDKDRQVDRWKRHPRLIEDDLIVSNIPAKIGDEAIEREFILDPLEHLHPGGDYWFVVVSGLNRLIPALGRRHNLRLKEVKKRAGHTVYHIHKVPA